MVKLAIISSSYGEVPGSNPGIATIIMGRRILMGNLAAILLLAVLIFELIMFGIDSYKRRNDKDDSQ